MVPTGDVSDAESWAELKHKLWGLVRVVVPYSTDTFTTFPDASEQALVSLQLAGPERFADHLMAVGDEFVRLSSPASQLPKLQVRLTLWVFTALLTVPDSVEGRDEAVELAWRWHDKLDEAFGRASVVG